MIPQRFHPRAAFVGSFFLLLLAVMSTASGDVTLRRIALAGAQAPGAPPGALFEHFGTFPGFGDDFPPRIDSAGNVTFHAVLTGTGVTGVSLADGNALGIWKHVAGGTSLVMRQDDPAPGTPAEFSAFSTGITPEMPQIVSGLVGFAGLLRGSGVDEQFGSNSHGVWREEAGGIQIKTRQGDPAPGLTSGHTLRVIGVPYITSSGIAFNGVYATPAEPPSSVTAEQEGFWTDRSGALEALALGLHQAPGMAPGVVFGKTDFTAIEGAFRSWGSNEALKLAFHGNLKGPGIDALNDEGIWIEQDGALTLLVREGDPSPAVGPGVRFGINSGIDTFGDVLGIEMNNLGAIVFGARHRGGAIPFTRGVWTTRSGALELVAHGTIPVTGSAPGSPAPGMGPGATFSAIPFVELNDANQIAFSGFATIDMNFDNQPQGVWWDRPGALTLVAREGDPVPTLPEMEFAGFNRTLSFGNGGHLAFLADLREGATGEGRGVALVMTDPEGGLHVIARSDVMFDVAGDGSDLRQVAFILPSNVSPAGEIAFELDFVDGSSAIYVAEIASQVGVAPVSHAATRVSLAPPRPNPRLASAPLTLRFTVDAPAAVRVSLLDVAGREVAIREVEHVPAAGQHELRWSPGRVAAGVYFLRLSVDSGASAYARCVMLE